jgi:hypothetical protein
MSCNISHWPLSQFFICFPRSRKAVQIAFAICAIIAIVEWVADRGFVRICGVAPDHHSICEATDMGAGIRKNVIVFGPSPNIEPLFPRYRFANGLNIEKDCLAVQGGMGPERKPNIVSIFGFGGLRPDIWKVPVRGYIPLKGFRYNMVSQVSRWRGSGVVPNRSNIPIDRNM